MGINFKMNKAQLYGAAGAAIVFCIDLSLPLGVVIGVLYMFNFLLISRETKKTIVTFAIVVSFLIFLKLAIFYTSQTSWMVIANRCISIAAVIVNAWLVIQRRNLYEKNKQRKRRAGEKILYEKNQLKTFIEYTPVAIAMLDMDMRYISVSKVWKTTYKLEEEHVIGRSHNELFPEITAGYWKAHYQRCLAGEIVRNDEDSFIRSDGSVEWLKWEIRPWYEDQEKIGGLVMFTEIITEQKEVKEELIRAEQSAIAKANFLSTMSHEIRTPMNAVLGFTTILLQNAREDQIEHLKLIKYSGDNLLVLINDILDFSKIEAGKIDFEKVDFNIKELIYNIQGALLEKARNKGILLKVRLDDKLPEMVMGDSVRLGQILTNLASNAVKFTETGKVIISASVVSQSKESNSMNIVFEVNDTGIGIPKDKQEFIFESFTQASSETSRKYGGTGLGLAISKRLIELQGSSIQLDSELGKGSSFSFHLNMGISATYLVTPTYVEANESNQLIVQKTLKGLRILIVDDNKINVLLVKQFFKLWNIESDKAENGLIAVEKVKQKDYDLVLMDLQMPVMDGYDATRAIRKLKGNKYQALPIIALTASAVGDVKADVLKSGMNDYISKPFNPETLFNKIDFYTKSSYPYNTNKGLKKTG
ncbi:PAS domain-containing hybrid sensor histidine kinase/response regulator [Flavobacterium undicola]|uniref:PAS domain-containing hybrid sensor histidine kinase/response regulator n=1 Tax=Flavobacterium undicola TaxID=1932779 RepID=UPI0013788962|nr:response regulator [Flavobacterium undicola]MBA0884864.1 response regulator [Flavobacterium undicola]